MKPKNKKKKEPVNEPKPTPQMHIPSITTTADAHNYYWNDSSGTTGKWHTEYDPPPYTISNSAVPLERGDTYMITPTDSNTIYIKPDDIGISKMHVKYEANRRAIGFLEHSMMRIGSNTEYIIMCHPMSLESKIFDEIRSKAFLGMRREDWGHIIISTVPNGLYLMVTEMDFEMDTGGLPTIHITAIEYTGPKPEKKIKKDPILTNLVKQIEEFENKIKEIKLKRRLENER